MSIVTKFGVTPKVGRILVTMGLAAAISQSTAFSQTVTACGPEVKETVARMLASVESSSDAQKVAMQDEVYKKYAYCGQQDVKLAPAPFFDAARECGAAVSNLGSIFFEEMSCVGYDPQRRQFAAPVKIKQVNGFGGTPLPGSREYVLHCVADGFMTHLKIGLGSGYGWGHRNSNQSKAASYRRIGFSVNGWQFRVRL